MKCSKRRPVFCPRVENLESRLQPGSVITGSGYGWSLLADHLAILNQGAVDSQGLVSLPSSASNHPNQTSAPVDVHSDTLNTAVASIASARSASLPIKDPV